MNKHIVAHVELKDNEYLETKKRTYKKQPNYHRVGNGTMNKHGIESIDFIKSVMLMTKAEQLVIETISDLITWDTRDGEVYVPLTRTFDKSKSKVFLKGFALLKKKDLVRRTKQSHYMINPNAFVPPDYEKAKEKWDDAGEVSNV